MVMYNDKIDRSPYSNLTVREQSVSDLAIVLQTLPVKEFIALLTDLPDSTLNEIINRIVPIIAARN
jgi:hypothetical protein